MRIIETDDDDIFVFFEDNIEINRIKFNISWSKCCTICDNPVDVKIEIDDFESDLAYLMYLLIVPEYVKEYKGLSQNNKFYKIIDRKARPVCKYCFTHYKDYMKGPRQILSRELGNRTGFGNYKSLSLTTEDIYQWGKQLDEFIREVLTDNNLFRL